MFFKLVRYFLFVVALLLGAFAYYGLYTAEGSSYFAGWDGIFPLFSGFVSCFLFLITFLLWRRSRRKKHIK